MTNYVCRNRILLRWRSATPIEGGEGKDALENMAVAIRER